jgi:hypothetical protein
LDTIKTKKSNNKTPKKIVLWGVLFLFIEYKEKKKTVNEYISYFRLYNLVPSYDNYLLKNKNSCNFAA